MFDYTSRHEAITRRCPMTEPGPKLVSGRAASQRRAIAGRSATFGAAASGRRALVVLLPSANAATILLLCEQAAELAG
jgi:hypothetical protein